MDPPSHFGERSSNFIYWIPLTNHKIKSIRKKIDSIDHQLLELIQNRGSLAQEIGDLKGLIASNTSF